MASTDVRPPPKAGGQANPAEPAPPTGSRRTLPVGRGKAGRNYLLICGGFVLSLILASLFTDHMPVGRVLYVTLLCAICAGPFLIGSGNPRHRILAIFMGAYFIIFGMSTYFAVLSGESIAVMWGDSESMMLSAEAFLTASDFVVLLGGIAFLGGYYLMYGMRIRKSSGFLSYEWRYGTILRMGLLLWGVGFLFMLNYDTISSVYYMPTTVLGLPIGVASNFRLLAPLGAVTLIYLITRNYRPALVWTLLIAIMGTEFVFGFIVSSKETSFRIAVLLLLGLFYLRGKVNFRIIGIMLVVSIPYLLYFNAYRMNMMERGYIDAASAFEAFEKDLDTVKGKTEGAENVAGSSLRGLRQRVDGKVYIDIIVAGTSSGKVDYVYADTLLLFFQSFIPRFIWPEKPIITTGQMFNREFGLSASRYTFVPTTQLGELYWSFAWPGVIIGMMAIGMVFARIGTTVFSGMGMTLPRFLLLMMSTYFLAIRFEGNIASQYSTVVRLLILVWLLDQFLRWMGVSRRVRPDGAKKQPAAAPAAKPAELSWKA